MVWYGVDKVFVLVSLYEFGELEELEEFEE